MANWQINKIIKRRQLRSLIAVSCAITLIAGTMIVLLLKAHPKKSADSGKKIDITGIVDDSFTKASSDNAMIQQQTELESLKKQISELQNNLKSMVDEQQKALEAHKEEMASKLTSLTVESQEKSKKIEKDESAEPTELKKVENPNFWHNPNNSYPLNNTYAMNGRISDVRAVTGIHSVSFRRPKSHRISHNNYLNPAHYVPSNTSVRAVILGGADADASVNGQAKNNGVMLFKFLEDGTLPNGAHSHLMGCRVSANSYGDISSERAFATLYRLSCAHPGQPIIDKEVTGWVFFNGKVGIKGQPLMRDNKVMTWAGISGALSGIAQAAQYAQSIQAIGPYGATSVIPSSQVAPFAAYGGAAKAADTLSQYYVKRAEQYHPVIQVGAGNVVTIVFKDGFYLEPDEKQQQYAKNQLRAEEESRALFPPADSESSSEMNFTVPQEVLGKIDRANALSRNKMEALG